MSNGCSGGVSWIYGKVLKRDVPFLDCCIMHDNFYSDGGTRADRLLADKRFRQCVKDTGRPVRAWIFYVAVRLFGAAHWNENPRK